VTVSDAHETAGFGRIADTAVSRQCRVGAERAREGRHAINDLGCKKLIRCNALLDPFHEWAQFIGSIRPGTPAAMRHAPPQEKPGEFLRAPQSCLSLPVIVPALASLARNQSFIVSDGVQRRDNGIGKAMKE